MNEAVAEQEQSFAGQKLRPRKRKAKTEKAKPPSKEQLENVQKANEALESVSEVLNPEPPSVIIVTMPDGEERKVQILKCKARQIGYVMNFLASAFKAMGADTFEDAASMTEGLNNPTNLLTLVSSIMDDALGTASMLTDLPHEDMLELELDDAVAVLLAVWSVNQAFFLSRVLPMIQGLIGRGELDQASAKTPSDTVTVT